MAQVKSVGEAKETFVYHSLDELVDLSDEELQALWDLVPNETRSYISGRYTESVKKYGIVQDNDELRMVESYLQRYKLAGLVPAGKDAWANVRPVTMQQIIDMSENELIEVEEEKTTKSTNPPFFMFAVFGVGFVFIAFLLSGLFSGDEEANLELTGTATETLTPTATSTSTPLPTNTPFPTQTPFAFTNVDMFVADGDRANRTFFPVSLSIGNGNSAQRVYIVQERQVETAEWVYESNSDVATWLSQSLVRPVLAIPYSISNEEFLLSLQNGFSFRLRMNTGAELVFDYVSTSHVGRNDTSFFLQDSPGIVLALVGKLDEYGMPVSQTILVTGSYRSSSELDQLAFLQSSLGAIGDIFYPGDAAVAMTGFEYETDFLNQNLVSDFVLVVVDVYLTAYTNSIFVDSLQFSLVDQRGIVYVPAWSEEYPLALNSLNLGESSELHVPFLLPRAMGDSEFRVRYQNDQIAYRMMLRPPQMALVSGIDVQIISYERDARNVYVSVRFYNGQDGVVYLSPSDVTIVYGYVPQPVGVSYSPELFSGLSVEPGQGWDVDFQFSWNGRDPYGMFMVAGRSYSMTIIEVGRN